jgi:hypothetical protein
LIGRLSSPPVQTRNGRPTWRMSRAVLSSSAIVQEPPHADIQACAEEDECPFIGADKASRSDQTVDGRPVSDTPPARDDGCAKTPVA